MEVKKINLLSWLSEEVQRIVKKGKFVNPDGKVDEHAGEVVICTITDPEAMALFTLSEELRVGLPSADELKAHSKRYHRSMMSMAHDPRTCEGCVKAQEWALLAVKYSVVTDLWWATMKLSLNQQEFAEVVAADQVSIREDWQLVAVPSSRTRVIDLITSGSFPFPIPMPPK